jgi:hypothetical protein
MKPYTLKLMTTSKPYDYSVLSVEKNRVSDNNLSKSIKIEDVDSEPKNENNPRKFMESFQHKIAEIKRINKIGNDDQSLLQGGNLMSELRDMEDIQLHDRSN